MDVSNSPSTKPSSCPGWCGSVNSTPAFGLLGFRLGSQFLACTWVEGQVYSWGVHQSTDWCLSHSINIKYQYFSPFLLSKNKSVFKKPHPVHVLHPTGSHCPPCGPLSPQWPSLTPATNHNLVCYLCWRCSPPTLPGDPLSYPSRVSVLTSSFCLFFLCFSVMSVFPIYTREHQAPKIRDVTKVIWLGTGTGNGLESQLQTLSFEVALLPPPHVNPFSCASGVPKHSSKQ